jgi:hypothetical protein
MPEGHDVSSHVPFTHVCPLAQTVPQAPQCWGLLVSDTHSPEHIV